VTNEERQRKIEQYARGPSRLKEALLKVPAEALHWRPAEGKWSVHEVICHCADSETSGAIRIRYLLAESHPTIVGYDQDRWAKELDYQHHPIEAALATVEAVRANTLPILRRLGEREWSREGTHTESGRYTAESWLDVYSAHLETHARQIERNLAQWQAR
jgi:hypothetical protein